MISVVEGSAALKDALEPYGNNWANLVSQIEHSNFKNLTVGQRLTYTIYNNNIKFNSDTKEDNY
ncbi:hypothetical protein, partial [uncultured Nostoc sp.]|uniref:hypothetical protein n=1 Tax=uncultured Nostoc sp. TaxID=340711 RepID=UPI0035C9B615